ncbi:MAG: hypothetical protein WDW38_009257 [Sanguina aurantia]
MSDDATSTLLVIKGGVLLFAYDLAVDAPGAPEQLKWTYMLQEGPPVIAMRVSLDGKTLALQRSAHLLEFVDLASGNVFVHGSHKGKSDILGFFFSEAPGADVVLVTRGGLELCQWVPRRQGLRCKETVARPVHWYHYTHETRMLIMGTGAPGAAYVQAYQFVAAGSITLPPFAVAVLQGLEDGVSMSGGLKAAGRSRTDDLRLDADGTGSSGFGTPRSGTPQLPVSSRDLGSSGDIAGLGAPLEVQGKQMHLLKMYGRVYCAFHNTASSKLELYRFFTDTVVLQHTYPLSSHAIGLSVVDNVLLVTLLDSAVVMLLDVAADVTTPVSDPLPLAMLPPVGSPGGVPSGMAPRVQSSSTLSMSSWSFELPGMVVDVAHQAVYRLYLDLRAVAASCSDPALLAGFLQRRRPTTVPPSILDVMARPPGHAHAGEYSLALAGMVLPKQLLFGVVRGSLQERLPMPVLRKIFDSLTKAYSEAMARQLQASTIGQVPASAAGSDTTTTTTTTTTPAGAPPRPVAPLLSPQVISPMELSQLVFRWLHDEEVVDAPYLQAALTEFKCSAVSQDLQLPAYIQSLSLDVMLQQSQQAQVDHMLCAQGDFISADVLALLEARPAANSSSLAHDAAKHTHALVMGVYSRMAAANAAANAVSSAGSEGGASGSGPELASAVALAAAAAAAAAGRSTHGWVTYVQKLLEQGEVLRAVRVAREHRGVLASVTPKLLLAAAASTGRLGTLAAVYRTFKDELLPTYPKFELARNQLLPGILV